LALKIHDDVTSDVTKLGSTLRVRVDHLDELCSRWLC